MQVYDIAELSTRHSVQYRPKPPEPEPVPLAAGHGPRRNIQVFTRNVPAPSWDLWEKAKALIPTKTPTKTPGVRGHAVSCRQFLVGNINLRQVTTLKTPSVFNTENIPTAMALLSLTTTDI